jgi:hypothetical protein
MGSAKEINDRLQATIAELPNSPKIPIAFAGSIKAIELLTNTILGRRQNTTPFHMPIPCYKVRHPNRFGLNDSEFLPILNQAEMYAIFKIDEIETDQEITQAVSQVLFPVYKKQFEDNGSLDIPLSIEVDVNSIKRLWGLT